MTNCLHFLGSFDHAWVIDFEYNAPDGECPTPLCGVGYCVKTHETRVWRSDLPGSPMPYTTGPRDLVICYNATAEGSCILALGWPWPTHTLDLLPCYQMIRNRFQSSIPHPSLIEAAAYFDITAMDKITKEKWRSLALGSKTLTEREMEHLTQYCSKDVCITAQLLEKMIPQISLKPSLFLGRYILRAVSTMERNGVPLDIDLLTRLKSKWKPLRGLMIEKVDAEYNVYDGQRFSHGKFLTYLNRQGILWPRTPKGRLQTNDGAFEELSKSYPQLTLLKELRRTPSGLKEIKLVVGKDGHNRTHLFPLNSRTGRNQPSSTQFILQNAKWLRQLIIPPKSKAIIHADYSQQEFLIAAVLSADSNMLKAYKSGDPYLHTAILSGEAPQWATKESHPNLRDKYKTLVLSVQYGCGVKALGRKVGGESLASKLLADHKKAYPDYWEWTHRVVAKAAAYQPLKTILGWEIKSDPLAWKSGLIEEKRKLNERSVINWPVQSTGADILRMATLMAVEQGLQVIATQHDSITVLCDESSADDTKVQLERYMQQASMALLHGEVLRTESKTIFEGERFSDPDGEKMFETVMSSLALLEGSDHAY